ncbi:hypothetical protein ACKWTF_003225 [Chironomus riparius]
MLKAFILVTIIALCVSKKVYDGYKVYDIKVKNQNELKLLENFEANEVEKRELDFLSLHNNVNDVARVVVKPSEQKFVENFFKQNKLDYKVSSNNIQHAIDKEYEEYRILSQSKSDEVTFDRYYRYEEIEKFLDKLEGSNSNVKVENIGKSFEGRNLKTVTITKGDGKSRNSVFIDGGIHAREWIAPAMSLYLIDQLMDSQSNFSKLLDQMDFVIQPVVNPDGYDYTFKFFRLWRKTRSYQRLLSCRGVDANRNYDFEWSTAGASDNGCADTYHGAKPFSENETLASRDVIEKIKDKCKFFLTFHSYGNYLIYPNGYTKDLPENWEDQDEVAKAGADAIEQATGTKYTYGSVSNTLYIASGSSTDYAYGSAKIPIAICMELPGGGFFGFDLPASEIEKTVKESIIGVQAMVEAVARKYPN